MEFPTDAGLKIVAIDEEREQECEDTVGLVRLEEGDETNIRNRVF